MSPATASREPVWSTIAIGRLLDPVPCPVCEAPALVDRRCRRCGADFSGPIGGELWDASLAAAEALRARQGVLARVPFAAPRAAAAPAASAVRVQPTAVPASGTFPPPRPFDAAAPLASAAPAAAPSSSATVQSVLAVAGAGLFAIAAIVFTFFNPELTDHTLRSIVVAVVTVLFLGAARLLMRAGLRFSAEAVGALGMVFLALDVHAASELAPPDVSPWVFAAVGTLLAGAAMTALAVRFGIRSWLWLSLVALAGVPAMLGFADATVTGTAIGVLASGLAAFALLQATAPLARAFGSVLRAERVALTVVELLSAAVVVGLLPVLGGGAPWATAAGLLAGVAVLALVAARQLLPRTWSMIGGAAGAGALAAVPPALPLGGSAGQFVFLFLVPAAASAAVVVLGVWLPLPREVRRRFVAGGALGVTGAVAVMPLGASLALGAWTLLAETDAAGYGADVASIALGLLAVAIGLRGYAAASGIRWIGELGVWFAVASALTVVCWPVLPPWSAVALALVSAAAASLALAHVRPLRNSAIGYRLPVIVGAHLAVVLGIVMSWRVDDLAVAGGVAVVATVALLARAIPPGARFVYVGAGYAFALLVFARGLDLAGVGTIPVLCLTTSAAAVGAIVATYLRAVGPRAWWAILVVTSVPFVLGVAQVVFERSGWTALSTGLIFALALALVLTRRPGLGAPLRAIAAGLLVPALAVVVVCLGAQLLVDSGSPVVLPVVAALVALVLPATALVQAALLRRGLPTADASAARLAIEASSLLTGAIAVVLGLARDAAGLGTTCLVLVILGIGAGVTALWGRRAYGWWMAAAAFTGALWCAWGLAGVTLPEPYVLPPAIAAAVVGAILTWRGAGGVALYATGLAVAVLPELVLLAVAGTPGGVVWRAYGLVAASWLLLAVGIVAGRTAAIRSLRVPTLATAIAAGAAGAVQGVRLGLEADASSGPVPLVLVCAALALLGAVPAFAAGRGVRSGARRSTLLARSRWLVAPAALYPAVGTWTAIRSDWFTIWSMWALMLACLAAVVAVAWRVRTRATGLPPVWFVFAIAFVTAIVAWSPRELRVEWFSLPLGVALLVAGALHLGRAADVRPTPTSWPAGFAGSWALLAPGLVVMLSASIAATFTDPLTWRAILVIVIALLAILVGASRRLAAPFLIGVVVLPVENALAFLVQIGRGIESMPWWITLAVVGAVLLIIAVTYERRADGQGGIAARLRDLA